MSLTGDVVDRVFVRDEAPPSRTEPSRGNDGDGAVVTRANEQRHVHVAAVGPRLRQQDRLARLVWAIGRGRAKTVRLARVGR